jgi:hypothetical protein
MIGKVNNRFLQCLWLFHALILAYVRLCVKYIVTQGIPLWRGFERCHAGSSHFGVHFSD